MSQCSNMIVNAFLKHKFNKNSFSRFKYLYFFVFLQLFNCKSIQNNEEKITLDLPEVYTREYGLFDDLSKHLSDTLAIGEFHGKDVYYENGKYSYRPKTDKITYHNHIYFKYKNAKRKVIEITDSVNVYKNYKFRKPYISQVVCFDSVNKFIEIKNQDFHLKNYKGNFYLAFYLDGKDVAEKPNYYIDLGEINKSSIKVFRNSKAIMPSYILEQSEIWPALDLYDGINDKIILTTSSNEKAYVNKIDNFTIDFTKDSIAASYVKLNCEESCKENKAKNYDWIYFTKEEVCKENSLTNAQLGRHYDTLLTFRPIDQSLINGYWDETEITENKFRKNETLPDRSRNVHLNFDFNTKYQGELEVFSLNLNYFVKLIVSDNHKIIIHNSLDLEYEATILFGENAKIEY